MPTALPDEHTISIPQAAEILGISRAAAYRLAATGQIPVIDLGNRTRRVHLAEFIAKFGLAPTA